MTEAQNLAIGYFAQHQLDLLRPESSPVDHLRDYAPDDREQDHRNYLGRFGFSGDRIFEPVAPFSGGEKARLVLALMIRQRPNLLLLDEPTNHLDLEMRQALSVALIEYSGALVVISHDRHLLRSVCDELLIVHDGIVDRFDRSLDDYPAWLREQEEIAEQGAEKWQDDPAKKVNKKQLRQQQAQRVCQPGLFMDDHLDNRTTFHRSPLPHARVGERERLRGLRPICEVFWARYP